MYPYIVCFCGCSLGDVFDAFKVMRAEKYRQALGVSDNAAPNPAMLAITNNIDVRLTDIFEQLCITQECCQTRIATQVEFKEFY